MRRTQYGAYVIQICKETRSNRMEGGMASLGYAESTYGDIIIGSRYLFNHRNHFGI